MEIKKVSDMTTLRTYSYLHLPAVGHRLLF